jgi:hypothetical protein
VKTFNNQRGIYPEHPKRIIKNGFHFRNPAGLIQDQSWDRAERIEVIDIDAGVHR